MTTTTTLSIQSTRNAITRGLTFGTVQNQSRIDMGYTHTITGTITEVENVKYQKAVGVTAILYLTNKQMLAIKQQAEALFSHPDSGLKVEFKVQVTKLGKPQASDYNGVHRVQIHISAPLNQTFVVYEAEEDWDEYDEDLLEIGKELAVHNSKMAKAKNTNRQGGLMNFFAKAKELLNTPIGAVPEEQPPVNKKSGGRSRKS